MAQLMAILPALGAGAAATGTAAVATGMSTGAMLMLGVSAASTVMSGISSYNQGQAQQEHAELQSRAAEVNGRMQAVALNEELLETMSRNNAAAAASGLQTSGSVARAQDAAQAKAAQELSVSRFNVSMQKTALTAKAKAAGSSGKAALAGSLFDAVGIGYGGYQKYKET